MLLSKVTNQNRVSWSLEQLGVKGFAQDPKGNIALAALRCESMPL